MNDLLSLRSRLLVIALFGTALLVIPAQQATAQSDGRPSLIQHLRTELTSDDAMRRENALVDVIALSGCAETCTVSLQSIEKKKLSIANETGSGSVIDFTNLIPDLLEAYRSGPADGHRLLALSALLNIGDGKALEQLLEEGAFQSETINRSTQKSLAAFYLNRYPELADRAFKTKRISIEDVRRAESLRIRRMNGEG